MDELEESSVTPEIVEPVPENGDHLLSLKSRERYYKTLKQFKDWQIAQGHTVNSYSENALLDYFTELSKRWTPLTLWSQYSMLKSSLLANENINIAEYSKLRDFLKVHNNGYKPKKSKILSKDEVDNFITNAPDEQHLLNKVILAFGICGACRAAELLTLSTENIKNLGNNVALIDVKDTKTKKDRTFSLTGKFYEVYDRYAALRPPDLPHTRFLIAYNNAGNCTKQPVGKNKIGSVPSIVAKYLKLPNPSLYTAHCFRRSSASIYANSGTDLFQLKRDGCLESSTVSEDYIDDSMAEEMIVEPVIKSEPESSRSPSPEPIVRKSSKRKLTQEIKPEYDKKPNLSDLSRCSQEDNESDNEWDMYGKTIGVQLKGLDKYQAIIAQKLFSDVIFNAKMGHLRSDSFIQLSPFDN